MRVLLLPDAARAEKTGGLRTQVMETFTALCALGPGLGVEVELAPPQRLSRFANWDVVHLFGTGGGNAAAIATAAGQGVAAVLSPRLSRASSPSNGSLARVGDCLPGNRSATGLDSGYAQIRRSFDAAQVVVARGDAEREAICDAFLVSPEKVALVPQGVAARFLEAGPELFREQLRCTGPFALMVGQIAPYNNQLAVARALAELALPLVVIGEARERDASYLSELSKLRTVRCLGPFAYDDPLLASAYAAASVFVSANTTAGTPMAAAEALAAGTPVVSRIGNDIPASAGGGWVTLTGRDDPVALQRAVSALLERPVQRETVRAAVRQCSWSGVALRLSQCYRQALARSGAALV